VLLKLLGRVELGHALNWAIVGRETGTDRVEDILAVEIPSVNLAVNRDRWMDAHSVGLS
jgi:hypothetical protein